MRAFQYIRIKLMIWIDFFDKLLVAIVLHKCVSNIKKSRRLKIQRKKAVLSNCLHLQKVILKLNDCYLFSNTCKGYFLTVNKLGLKVNITHPHCGVVAFPAPTLLNISNVSEGIPMLYPNFTLTPLANTRL